MKFEKRLRALEARLIADPVVLHFTDGSTRAICGKGDYLLDLLIGACGGADLSPEQAEQIDLVRRCVSATEPGGARIVELMQSLLNAPAEGPSGVMSEV